MIYVHLTRWILSVALLAVAWCHAHWSLSLVVTLLAVRCELVDSRNWLERQLDKIWWGWK